MTHNYISYIPQFLFPFLISIGISFFLVAVSITIARKLGLVDKPSRNHPGVLHTQPIPRAGGLALFLTLAICTPFFVNVNPFVIGLLIGGGLNAAMGFGDDKFNLSPQVRLAVQLLSGVITVLSGIPFYTRNIAGDGLEYYDSIRFTIPFLEIDVAVIGSIIFIAWIVWIMNTTNWTKGASQLPGVSAIAFLTLAGVALKYQTENGFQVETALLAVVCAGAVLGMLPFNFPPEKMFPNFGASTFIGYNLAVLSVLSGGKIATLLIVFAIPIIDALLVGIKRIVTRQNPMVHDRGHLYHFLLDAGLTKRQIIYLYWVTAAILGITTIFLETRGKIIVFGSMFILLSSYFYYLYKKH